jgi:hypothetical protein|tara:strand:+ start:2986 stop:5148 length:2163 start_codon:yes stop_codon:yes gene_type:complete
MNPLHRKMFRQPGMSRQPAGILASSPELSNVVRQRMGQPVQMANGGQTVTDYMSAIRDLAAKGDKATLNNIATDQRLPRSVQMAAANALAGRSGVPDQIQAAPVSDAERMAANRSNLAALRSAQGLGQGADIETVPSDPLLKVGKVNFGNILSDATGRQPVGQSEGGKKRSAALTDAPGKIASGLTSGIGQVFDELGNIMPQAAGYAPSGPRSSYVTPRGIKDRGKAAMGMTDDPYVNPDGSERLVRNPVTGELGPGTARNIDAAISARLADDDVTAGEELAASSRIFTDPDEIFPDAASATKPPTDVTPRKVSTIDSDAKTTPAGQLQSIFGRDLSPSEVTQSFEADINKFNNAYLTGITENKEAVIDSEARLKSATELFDKTLNEKRKTAKEFTLEDVKDEALKISGIDKTDYDDKRKDAFFMGLMRAGLAIAAGESPNTLTNVARGLGVGLEGYGKDISTLNAQEREDRKELRAISMDLIKTKNDREMALTAAENEHLYQRQRLAQAEKQGADSALLAAQNRENSYKLNGLQLQANLSYQLNQLKQADKKLAVDTAYKEWSAKIAMLPEEAKQTMVIDGFGGYNAKTGQFELTEEGQTYYKNLVALGSKSSYKITDLDKQANALSTGGNLFGVNLSTDSATAKNQSLRWMTNFKERYDKASQDITDPLKKTEAEKQRTAILTEWQMSESPTISTKEEFDALPSGSMFVQNNVLQRKP